ncbi:MULTISPECIES: Tic20 family protein [Spirulina sp. CCY15215]|uniref:Tic20 family protein n=1 Tax=Spirulina sp. CCY15215 TaxID=2767591 RepID=UPI001950F75B|nr:Tic20 family protein [Spirulina major]
MTWRGSTTTQDKILAALTYLIPILEALPFGMLIFALVPFLAIPFIPLFMLLPIYFLSIGGLAIVEMGIFFAVYILVVQNQRLPHFLRFNALQALLISIFAFLCRLALDILGLSRVLFDPLVGRGNTGAAIDLGTLLSTTVFIGVIGVSGYAIAQCFRGRYAEIPTISEAAYSQIR